MVRAPKRMTQWVGPADQNYVNVTSGGATLVSSVLFGEPGTVIRVRGQISIKPTTYAVDLTIVGAWGMGIVSEEAFNAGVASIPEPFSDADWGGWLAWRNFSFHFEQISNAGVFLASWDFEVDSKAMRKIGVNEVLVHVAESNLGAYSIAEGVRTLFKLH